MGDFLTVYTTRTVYVKRNEFEKNPTKIPLISFESKVVDNQSRSKIRDNSTCMPFSLEER